MAAEYVISFLSFNMLVVTGGLEDLYEARDGFKPDQASMEDRIVTQAFEPVLTMLEDHPTWQMSMLVPGYMVDVLRARHTGALGRLRALADAGQVELVSVQWASNFMLAYPTLDAERSWEMTKASYAAADLPLSDVAAATEHQFGPGLLEALPGWGYRAAVLDPEIYSYFHDLSLTSAAYDYEGVRVLTGGVAAETDAGSVTWHYYGDGLSYATGGVPPQAGPDYTFSAIAMDDHEKTLKTLERTGATIASLGTVLAAIDGESFPTLPGPVPDGIENTEQADATLLWMGYGGTNKDTAERDNHVLATTTDVRHRVAAAEQVPGVDTNLLAAAWADLLVAEGTSGTGQNPSTDVVTGVLDAGESAREGVRAAIQAACASHGASSVTVDLSTGTATWDAAPIDEGGTATNAPIQVLQGERDQVETWLKLASNLWRVDVDMSETAQASYAGFGWNTGHLGWVPALTDRVEEAEAADFAVEDELPMPTPSGVAELEEGYWLVKRTDTVNLAAYWRETSHQVAFIDETDDGAPAHWTFYVVKGDGDDALDMGRRLNVTPVVRLECDEADTGGGDDTDGNDTDGNDTGKGNPDCGCAATRAPLGLGVLLGALALRRRRR